MAQSLTRQHEDQSLDPQHLCALGKERWVDMGTKQEDLGLSAKLVKPKR